MTTLLIYLAVGACAGVLAGLLGIGGGLVLVAALVWLLPQQGVPAEAVMHVALATSLASIVLTGLSSARAHHRRGSVLWPSVVWLVPGQLVGGWLGGWWASALDGQWLRWGVAVFCLLAALQLLFGQPRPRDHNDAPRGPGLLAAGGVIGSISALVGIGGGSMTVPLLIKLGAEPVKAVASSAACGVAIGLSSALSYAQHAPPELSMPPGAVGYVFLPAAAGIALASVSTAPLGVRLAHAIGGVALKRVFAGLLLLVAVQMARG